MREVLGWLFKPRLRKYLAAVIAEKSRCCLSQHRVLRFYSVQQTEVVNRGGQR